MCPPKQKSRLSHPVCARCTGIPCCPFQLFGACREITPRHRRPHGVTERQERIGVGRNGFKGHHEATVDSLPRKAPLLGSQGRRLGAFIGVRSEEHTSELQSLMRISDDVFCLKKKKTERT